MPPASPFLIDATHVCRSLLSHSVVIVTPTRAAYFVSVATGRNSRRDFLNFPAHRSSISAATYVLSAVILLSYSLIILTSRLSDLQCDIACLFVYVYLCCTVYV